MYSDLIIDLSKNPINKRIIEHPTQTHSGANVTCGDHVRMYVLLATGDNSSNKTDRKILDCSFEGEGCAICIATSSLITEHAKGKTITEVLEWDSRKLFEFLEAEIGAVRIKCALLPLEVLHGALGRL